jgi:hypothetical protein
MLPIMPKILRPSRVCYFLPMVCCQHSAPATK